MLNSNASFYSALITLSLFNQSVHSQTSPRSYLKTNPVKSFDYDKPLFQLNTEQANNLNRNLRFYAMSGYREGIEPIKGVVNFDSVVDKKSGTLRVYMINLSFIEMLSQGYIDRNRIVLNVGNPSKFEYSASYGPKAAWMRENLHCFEYLQPFGSVKNDRPLMNTLAAVIGVDVSKRKENTKVLALKKMASSNQKQSQNKASVNNNVETMTINHLVGLLNKIEQFPVINATGSNEEVIITLGKDTLSDITELKKELNKNGLLIVDEVRELEMLFITDKNVSL